MLTIIICWFVCFVHFLKFVIVLIYFKKIPVRIVNMKIKKKKKMFIISFWIRSSVFSLNWFLNKHWKLINQKKQKMFFFSNYKIKNYLLIVFVFDLMRLSQSWKLFFFFFFDLIEISIFNAWIFKLKEMATKTLNVKN